MVKYDDQKLQTVFASESLAACDSLDTLMDQIYDAIPSFADSVVLKHRLKEQYNYERCMTNVRAVDAPHLLEALDLGSPYNSQFLQFIKLQQELATQQKIRARQHPVPKKYVPKDYPPQPPTAPGVLGIIQNHEGSIYALIDRICIAKEINKSVLREACGYEGRITQVTDPMAHSLANAMNLYETEKRFFVAEVQNIRQRSDSAPRRDRK